jgi:uncharacterized protein (DUF2252 family)
MKSKSKSSGRSIFDRIVRFNSDREPALVERKLARIDETVFAFFRGTDELFATAWRDMHPRDPGPALLCSGDLHLENFGACQTEDGDFRFEINDFDEALVAPCSLDLVRCTTSILLAGEVWALSPLDSTGIALVFLDRYRDAVVASAKTGKLGEIAPRSGTGPVWDLLNKTAQGTQRDLLDQQTFLKKHGKRQIDNTSGKHPPVDRKEFASVRDAVEKLGVRLKQREAYRVLDVTGRIAGTGSLGVRRYVVLIEGDSSPDRNRLLDVKEARPSVVVGAAGIPQPKRFPNEAERVVAAQRRLQARPARGLATVGIDGRAFRVRELISEEHRSNLNHLQKKPARLREAVEVVGGLVGWSQLRGLARGRWQSLARWSTGPAMDAVLAAAVRFADLTRRQYAEYHADFSGR